MSSNSQEFIDLLDDLLENDQPTSIESLESHHIDLDDITLSDDVLELLQPNPESFFMHPTESKINPEISVSQGFLNFLSYAENDYHFFLLPKNHYRTKIFL